MNSVFCASGSCWEQGVSSACWESCCEGGAGNKDVTSD